MVILANKDSHYYTQQHLQLVTVCCCILPVHFIFALFTIAAIKPSSGSGNCECQGRAEY